MKIWYKWTTSDHFEKYVCFINLLNENKTWVKPYVFSLYLNDLIVYFCDAVILETTGILDLLYAEDIAFIV